MGQKSRKCHECSRPGGEVPLASVNMREELGSAEWQGRVVWLCGACRVARPGEWRRSPKKGHKVK